MAVSLLPTTIGEDATMPTHVPADDCAQRGWPSFCPTFCAVVSAGSSCETPWHEPAAAPLREQYCVTHASGSVSRPAYPDRNTHFPFTQSPRPGGQVSGLQIDAGMQSWICEPTLSTWPV